MTDEGRGDSNRLGRYDRRAFLASAKGPHGVGAALGGVDALAGMVATRSREHRESRGELFWYGGRRVGPARLRMPFLFRGRISNHTSIERPPDSCVS